jgi:small subunit ribosomal protein S2
LNFFQVNGKKENMEKEISFNLNIEEMAKVGLHFGHKTSKVHPKMFPFIFGVRNNIHIIDLEKTKEKFEEALKFIQDLVLQNKVILFVGTKPQIKDLVKEIATELGFPYVNERWLGGTFTNFEVIKKRAEYLKDWKRKRLRDFLKSIQRKKRQKLKRRSKNWKRNLEE